MKYFRKIPLQFILFIFFFGCLACFINSKNTVAFGLQPLGIRSIVERNSFYIDYFLGSNPDYYTNNSTWDVFSYKGHVYLNKQPGQFFLGSIVYLFLYKLGITYENNTNLVCGLIALFTSVLMTAIMMILIFNIVFNITKSRKYSLLTTCFFGFGTLVLPYSGLLHHDICATFFLFLGFYFLFCKYYIGNKASLSPILLAGFFIGFSFFVSYNTPTIIFALFVYVLFYKNRGNIFFFTISLLAGLSLSFLFNFIVFENPLNFSMFLFSRFHNIAGNEISIKNIMQTIPIKLDAYLLSPVTAITFYSPIFLVSYLGFFTFPKKYLIEKVILPLVFILQFFQPLANGPIGAIGWCQYGPRYLLESMPFTLIGLSGFFAKETKALLSKYKFLLPLILIAGVISIITCAVGTMGVVYCGYYENAFLNYLKKIISGDIPKYNFLPLGTFFIMLSIFLSFLKYKYKQAG